MSREIGRAALVGIYRILAGSGIAALGFVAACYTYPSRPLTDVPPSAEVSATISDVGRVALAEPIGSGLPRSNHEASLYVLQGMFAWISDSGALANALEEHAIAATKD